VKWIKQVECNLREYLCRDELKEDILRELDHLDDYIAPSTSHITGMPSGRGLPSSIVERIVENREKARENTYLRLHILNERLNKMERALNYLSPLQREVILWCYFSVEYNLDEEIAKYLGLSGHIFNQIKRDALRNIYLDIEGIPHFKDSIPTRHRLQDNRTAIFA
jgi:hypothetical protein